MEGVPRAGEREGVTRAGRALRLQKHAVPSAPSNPSQVLFFKNQCVSHLGIARCTKSHHCHPVQFAKCGCRAKGVE
jgi:hypothetical protein